MPMTTDCNSEIEYRLIDIEAIAELFEVYINYHTNELSIGCLHFLSDNLQKNIDEINNIFRKQA